MIEFAEYIIPLVTIGILLLVPGIILFDMYKIRKYYQRMGNNLKQEKLYYNLGLFETFKIKQRYFIIVRR